MCARISLDLEDAHRNAWVLDAVGHQVGDVGSAAIGHAAVPMPPAVFAQVEGRILALRVRLHDRQAHLTDASVELKVRAAAFGEAGDGGGAGKAGSWLGRHAGAVVGLIGGSGMLGRYALSWATGFEAGGGGFAGFASAAGRAVLGRARGFYDGAVMTGVRAVYDAVDTAGFMVSRSPVSSLNRLDVPVVRAVNNPLFKFAGKAFAVFDGVENVIDAWSGSKGQNVIGRGYTVAASAASDGMVYVVPALGGADFLSFGAVRADLGAFGAMGGGALSEGLDRAAAAARRDLADHDYTGLLWHVQKDAAAGALSGADRSIDRWADDVSDGKYGGVLKTMSDVENRFIDDHYEQAAGAVSGLAHGASSLVSGASGILKGLR